MKHVTTVAKECFNDPSSMVESTTMVCWANWFNKRGNEEMQRGCFTQAAMYYDVGLSCLLSGQALSALENNIGGLEITADFANSGRPANAPIGGSRDNHYFLFGDALEVNLEHLGCSADIWSQRAITMFNLSVSTHQAGLHAGNEAWISMAKVAYQTTLQFLHAIDQTQAIRIGVFTFQNLAVIHYLRLEYDECFKCLQSLYLIAQLGIEDSVLDEAELGQVSMAMFFYSQPPTTAGCA